jgi:hypothetical protein
MARSDGLIACPDFQINVRIGHELSTFCPPPASITPDWATGCILTTPWFDGCFGLKERDDALGRKHFRGVVARLIVRASGERRYGS